MRRLLGLFMQKKPYFYSPLYWGGGRKMDIFQIFNKLIRSSRITPFLAMIKKVTDQDPDQPQNSMSSSLGHSPPLHQISWKSVLSFLSDRTCYRGDNKAQPVAAVVSVPGVSAQPGCMEEKWISLCWEAHLSVRITCCLCRSEKHKAHFNRHAPRRSNSCRQSVSFTLFRA